MKTLRILILAVTLPAFVSVVLTDAVDLGGLSARTVQISSAADDSDLLCDKVRQPALSGSRLPSAPVSPASQGLAMPDDAPRPGVHMILPFFLRAPPLFS